MQREDTACIPCCLPIFCFVLFCFVLFFVGWWQDRISLCNCSGCPGTHFVDLAGLKLTDIHWLRLPSAEIKGVYHHHQVLSASWLWMQCELLLQNCLDSPAMNCEPEETLSPLACLRPKLVIWGFSGSCPIHKHFQIITQRLILIIKVWPMAQAYY